MNYKTVIAVSVLLFTSACQHQGKTAQINANQNEANIAPCIRTVMALDEGRWAYMGTIARLNGKFRTYETTSVHAAAGPDMWSSKSFGGDVGGDEESAEIGYVKLVGTSIVPIEDGELIEAAAVNYLACVGPDAEGRYQATREYKIPNGDGTYDQAKNVSWYSQHGSYFVEDNFNEAGRVVARRSGVNTPIKE